MFALSEDVLLKSLRKGWGSSGSWLWNCRFGIRDDCSSRSGASTVQDMGRGGGLKRLSRGNGLTRRRVEGSVMANRVGGVNSCNEFRCSTMVVLNL